MRVLLLDNDDSFTWNLAQQIRSLGAECVVLNHRETSIAAIKKLQPDRIVISPGPGHPKDAKLANSLLLATCYSLPDSSIPILGVCLGHQCMAHVFGGASCIGLAQEVRHGKTSKIFHDGASIFKGIVSPFLAARYHSLIVKKLPKEFELLCWTGSQKKIDLIMGMKHKTLPIIGIQFHPESFLTDHGEKLMKNFLQNP